MNFEHILTEEEYLKEFEEENTSNSVSRNADFKSANADEGSLGIQNVSNTNSKHISPVKSTAAATQTIWNPYHVAFLDSHIYLNEKSNAPNTFQFINEQLRAMNDDYQNFKVYEEEYKTIGYHIDDSRECCYRIQLFEFNKKLGVNMTRLSGDTLALYALWNTIKKSLHEHNFYVDVFLAEGQLDDDIFGDEPEESGLDEDAFKYLDFTRDEGFVAKLIEDIKDQNVGTHSLLLLKLNLQKEQNMELVAEKFAQELFEAIMERISQQFNTMVDAICISHIVSHLFESATVAVTEQHVSNIIEAAEQWCGEQGKKTIVPTASEEASTILLEQLSTAIDLAGEMSEDLELQEKLTSIVNRTSFDRARDAAEDMVAQN